MERKGSEKVVSGKIMNVSSILFFTLPLLRVKKSQIFLDFLVTLWWFIFSTDTKTLIQDFLSQLSFKSNRVLIELSSTTELVNFPQFLLLGSKILIDFFSNYFRVFFMKWWVCCYEELHTPHLLSFSFAFLLILSNSVLVLQPRKIK